MNNDTPKFRLHDAPGYQISMLARMSERGFEQKIAPLGLTRPMWCVLLAVHEEKLSAPSDIADFIGIDRTATSRCLRQMEAKDFIKRENGTLDKRTTCVRITDKGIQALETAIPLAKENASRFTKKLTSTEQEELSRLIAKLMVGEDRNIPNL